jgi:hypothetical protein
LVLVETVEDKKLMVKKMIMAKMVQMLELNQVDN